MVYIQGRVATWLSEILGGRLQRVVLNQAASGWASITSGIPQGSVLRPLLFYFVSMTFQTWFRIILKCLQMILSHIIYSISDSLLLQQDLHKLSEWVQSGS